MSTIVYLHGLNSSKRSFGYIVKSLPEHSAILIDYDSHQPLHESLAQIRKHLPKGEYSVVGHSLGGVLATLLAVESSKIQNLYTISSPLGGSRAAGALRWFPGHPPILNDLCISSPHIQLLQSLKLVIPTTSIISTAGHLPISTEKNDSVVTLASQRALSFAKKVEIKANHFEILLHDNTVDVLQKGLFS